MLVLLGGSLRAGESGIRIVVHANVSEESVSKADLKALFLGDKKFLGTTKLRPVTLSRVEPVHSQFLRTYVGKTKAAFRNYWKRNVFSGKGQMPKDFKSEKALIAYIKTHPNTIGYIRSETPHSGVKVLTVKE